MRKNSITRFNSENIAYIDFDTDTKEGAAGVIDEVNGQTYPFNGGGGGISNPVIEVTFINNTGGSTGPMLFVFDENDNEMKWVQFNFANGATEVVDAVVIPSSFDGPEGPFSYFEQIYLYDITITASDAVNCTFDSGERSITVTDPTQNASITLTLS